MQKLPLAFFSAAALCVTVGMTWGIVIGMKQDFTTAPAHAHLNLVGWASLALMGTFYALTGKAGRIGWLNFFLSTSAVVFMVPFLALYLSGMHAAQPGLIVGSVLALLGMLTFLFNVLSTWRETKTA
jgi:hypothetical protein